MRERIWRFVGRFLKEGCLLPWWAIAIRFVLFPLDSFYWSFSCRTGYQPWKDEWMIHGIKFSGGALRMLGKCDGGIYKIELRNDVIRFELIGRQVTKPMPWPSESAAFSSGSADPMQFEPGARRHVVK